MKNKSKILKTKKPNMINLLRPYIWPIGGLMMLAIAANILGLTQRVFF